MKVGQRLGIFVHSALDKVAESSLLVLLVTRQCCTQLILAQGLGQQAFLARKQLSWS